MRTALAQSMMNQLRAWLAQARQQATEPEDVLQAAPVAAVEPLRQRVGELPVPVAYRQGVGSALSAAVERWQQGGTNSLVLLSRPVEPVATVLAASLEAWSMPGLPVVQPLRSYQRPQQPLDIWDKVRSQLSEAASNDSERIVVIPALERCYLRCIHGWAAVEHLQRRIAQERQSFWLVGCNAWSWAFLDRVCQVGAYLEQTQPLPELEGPDLQRWLALAMGAALPEPQPAERFETEDSDAFWKDLSRLSAGSSQIAAPLWLRSLGVRSEDLEALDEGSPLPLRLRPPTLPSLPKLTVLDRYVLHALLLHGPLGFTQLSQAMGEPEAEVRSQLQILRRAGLVECRADQLQVCPVHYPRLRTELGSNNFLVGSI